MSRYAVFAATFAVSLLPQVTSAAVVIHELMYDAQGTDTDQEYVEIYNNGATPVDLTKWRFNDGSSHALNAPPKNGGTGSITIPAGGYALLVDNATNFLAGHSGVSGTVIDTVMSLSNTGATISLIDDTGATADSVTYTKDQGANGDGNSLQLSNGTWIVAAPTPLSQNATTPVVQQTTDATPTSASTSTTSKNQSTQTTVSSYVAPPAPSVFADAGQDHTVTVGADTAFHGRAYDKNQDLVDNIRFNWNFGDGTTAEGQAVMHHFEYPGKYVVVLSIAQNISAASDHVVITAEPANLVFTVGDDGSIAIQNKAGRDIDISKWLVRSFARSFIFADDTVILAGQTLRISSATLGFPVGPQTELQYPNGTLAYRPGESAAQTPPIASLPVQQVQATSTRSEKKSNDAKDTVEPADAASVTPESSTTETAIVVATETQMAALEETGNTDGSRIWWLSALGLALVASGAAYAVKKSKSGEWNIVEEN